MNKSPQGVATIAVALGRQLHLQDRLIIIQDFHDATDHVSGSWQSRTTILLIMRGTILAWIPLENGKWCISDMTVTARD